MSYFNYTDYDGPTFVTEESIPPLELPKRTVYCHQKDVRFIKPNVLSDDIKVLTCKYLPVNQYMASKDIVIGFKFDIGSSFSDFKNNIITVVAYHTFS